MPYITYRDERREDVKKKIDKENLTIGRKEGNDVIFYDNYVSRFHAEIVKRGDKYFIIDKGSTYGTFVNENRVEERELNYGDKVRVGRSVFLFLDEKSEAVPLVSIWSEETSPAFKKFNALRDDVYSLKSIVETDSVGSSFTKIDSRIDDLRNYYFEIEKSLKLSSALFEIGKIINFIFDLDLLLNMIMDIAIKALGAERGFIMLLNQNNELEMKVARNFERGLVKKESMDISLGIARRTLKETSPVFTTDATQDERFSALESVMVHRIHSVICVPLMDRNHKVFGVIYVDSRKGGGLFSQAGVDFLTAFASQASIGIENSKLYERILQEERLRNNLTRYLPQPLVDKIISEKSELYLGGESKEITVMFTDIRGFTSISEKLEAQDVVDMLNEFFTLMTEEIFKEGGTLDKYIGDCIMSFFGAPIPQEDHAKRAVFVALRMFKHLESLKKQWLDVGKVYSESIKNFSVGIGINSGRAVVGNIGTMKRMDYTAIGDTVNLASRLEGVSGENQIVISEYTYEYVRDVVNVTPLDLITVKGRQKPVRIYLVNGLKKGEI